MKAHLLPVAYELRLFKDKPEKRYAAREKYLGSARVAVQDEVARISLLNGAIDREGYADIIDKLLSIQDVKKIIWERHKKLVEVYE